MVDMDTLLKDSSGDMHWDDTTPLSENLLRRLQWGSRVGDGCDGAEPIVPVPILPNPVPPQLQPINIMASQDGVTTDPIISPSMVPQRGVTSRPNRTAHVGTISDTSSRPAADTSTNECAVEGVPHKRRKIAASQGGVHTRSRGKRTLNPST